MSAKDIRNIVLLGHGGSGKTTLAESMLFMTGGTDRFGKVTDGNTTCDYDAEEIKRNISISLAVAPVKYKNVKINVLDTPGNFDFAGEVLSGIRAAECAVLVCGAKDGLSVGAERAWKMLGNKPRMIFINRTDEDNSDYQSCLDALKGKFGQAIAPIVAPVIDGNKKVTAIVDLLHNTAYEVKGGKWEYREPFLPLLPGVQFVEFGDADAVEDELYKADATGKGVAAVIRGFLQSGD